MRRGAKDIQIELDEVVKGDLMVLQSGNQICNDAVVVEGMLEVNESLLTGESDAVVKEAGSELYSEALSFPVRHMRRLRMSEMKIML